MTEQERRRLEDLERVVRVLWHDKMNDLPLAERETQEIMFNLPEFLRKSLSEEVETS